ncbi:septum formation initiator family protein [Nevskia sp.]|uniref:septum formation initiator family protein n=1 Tax=Nevskia sp. TaxID=1929292 RepID=UPI0025EED7AD|nr:septum formation initiator family protein [Nevskia sp.]
MNRRVAVVILGFMLAGLQYRFWIGDGGVYETGKQRMAVAAREADNAKLQLRNAALQAEVEDLRNGGAAIETHARKSLGMVKREETFFLVVNATDGSVGRP